MVKDKTKNIVNSIVDSKETIIVFLICFLPRVIGTFSMQLMSYEVDELSTISTAAIMAGYDWSKSLADSTFYYGGGMTVLFTPLFLLLRNPNIIYHIMLITMCFLQSLTGVIAFLISQKYFKIVNIKISMLIAVASSYMVTRRANNVTNEHILILLTWVICWLLLALNECEDKRKKNILSIVLALVMGYALTVHERGKVFVLALFCLLLLYGWVYKRLLIKIIPFGMTYVVLYYISKFSKTFIINHNWPTALSSVANSEVSVGKLDMLLHLSNWRGWFSCIIGQITTISVVTGGVFIIALVFAIIIICNSALQRNKYLECELENRNRFIILTFSFAAIFMTILAQSVSWLPGIVKAFDAGYDNNFYDLKAITYIRYFGIYVGPVMMIGMELIYKKSNVILKLWKQICAACLVCGLFWGSIIWPYISGNTSAIEAFLPFSMETKWNLEINSWFYLGGIVFLIISIVSLLLLIKYKRYYVVFSFICIIMLYQYLYNTYSFDAQLSDKRQAQENTYNNVFKNLEDLPEVIYVNNESREKISLTYQFLFFDKEIIPGLPDVDISEGIIITDNYSDSKNWFENGWTVVKHKSEREDYVFVKGANLISKLKEQGIKMIDYQPYKQILSDKDITQIDEKTFSVSLNQELPSGTYKVIVNGEKVDTTFQSISLNSDGEEVVEPITATQDKTDSSKMSVIFSVLYDYSNVDIIMKMKEAEIADISGISIAKISDDYNIGLDNNNQILNIIEKIKTVTEENKLLVLENERQNKNLSYLQSLIPEKEIHLSSEFQLLNNIEDILVLVPYQTQEWMPLLQKYDVIAKSDEYMLMVSKISVNNDMYDPGIQEYFDSEYVDLRVFEVLNDSGYVMDSYGWLRAGTYQIKVKVNNQDLEGDQVAIGISSNEEVVTSQATFDGEWISAQITLNNDISEWRLDITTVSGNSIQYSDAMIKQQMPLKGEIYDKQLHPLLDLANQFSNGKEIKLYSDLSELNVLIGNNQAVNIQLVKDLQINTEDGEYLIIPNNIVDIFNLLDRYCLVDATSGYILLVKSDSLQTLDLNTLGIAPLSSGKTLNTSYYKKSSDENRGEIWLPYGNYSVKVELELLGESTPGELGTVELWTQDGMMTAEELIISEEEAEAGKAIRDLKAASLEDIQGLYVEAYGRNIRIQARLTEVSQLTSYYMPLWEGLDIKGAEYDEQKGTIGGENIEGGMIATSSGLVEKKGIEYTYTFVYQAKNPDITLELYDTENDKTIIQTSKNDKIEDGIYESKLIVSPSENRYAANIIMKIAHAEDFELLEFKVVKE